MGPRARSLLLAIVVLASTAAGSAAAEDPLEVRVGPDREAEAEYVAVSLRGDSDAGVLAVSGTGSSSADVAASGTGNAIGRTAGASGTGGAAGILAVSGFGDTFGTIPVSAAGSCNFQDCYEVSLSGPAGGYYVAVADGQYAESQYVAVSQDGSAECTGEACLAASGTDEARGAVSTSLEGSALGEEAGVSATGPAEGTVAASGTGDAYGRYAASGTGHAGWFLAVSGCDVASNLGQPGRDAACWDSPEGLLP